MLVVHGARGAENVRKMWLLHYQALLLNAIPGSPLHINQIEAILTTSMF